MKNLALTIALSFWAQIAIANANAIESQVKQSLELWEPIKVQVKGDSLTITSKERRITDQIYRAMMGGLCMGTIPRPNSLDGISEIRILNQFGRQGYVFEGGRVECEELNNMPANQTQIYILGLTHMHTNE